MKGIIMGHLLTACVCTGGTTVAIKVQQARAAAPVVHHVKPVAKPKPKTEPIVQYVASPCQPEIMLPGLNTEPGTIAMPRIDALTPTTTVSFTPTGPAPITVLPPVSRVPEIGTWASMMVGFTTIGVVLRRRKPLEA